MQKSLKYYEVLCLIVFIFSGEEFVERRGPSPLTIKAEPDLGPSLKKILHLHLLSRHENDFINILLHSVLCCCKVESC